MSLRLGIAAVLVLATLCSAPAAAGPRKRVAVLEFSGPGRAAAQKAVVKALKRHKLQVVMRKGGARERDEDAIAGLARGARATAVVLGTLQKEGKRRVLLSLAVHNARTGARLEMIEVPLRTGRVDARAHRAIARDLLSAVRKGEPATAKAEKTALASATRASADEPGTTLASAPTQASAAPPPVPTQRVEQAADNERPKR